MVMLEDYGVSDEKGYADLKQLNKAIGMYIFTPRNCILYLSLYANHNLF